MLSQQIEYAQLRATVGSRLKKWRTDRKESIDSVATTLNISPTDLQKIEDGKINWRVDIILRLSRYYQAKVQDLFAEEPEKPSDTPINLKSFNEADENYTEYIASIIERANEVTEATNELIKKNTKLSQVVNEFILFLRNSPK